MYKQKLWVGGKSRERNYAILGFDAFKSSPLLEDMQLPAHMESAPF